MVSSIPTNPVSYLERNAKDAPNGTCIATAKQTITNAEALTEVKQIAYEMRRLGVKPGDMIAIDLPEVLTLLFVEAAFHEAAGTTLLPPAYDPTGVFTVDWMFTNQPEAHGSGIGRVVEVDDRFLALIEQNPYGISALDWNSPDDVMCVIFSSGTTGRPNAIPAKIGALEEQTSTSPEPWAQRGRFISFLPAKTPLGLFSFLLNVMDRESYLSVGDNIPAETVELVSRNGVRVFVMSPAQVAGFVGEVEATGRTLPQIEAVYTVGTAMSPELNARMRAATEGCEILCVYGSTEAGVAALRNYESDDPFDVGQVLASAQVQIVDDDDILLHVGEVGNIRYRPSLKVREYLGDPESTATTWVDDWFYPGDLGSLRPDGGLTLAGRASEIINAGGVKVNPVRLDQFATKQDGVLDAASFGYETADGILQVGIALVTVDGFDAQALAALFIAEFGAAAPQLVARLDAIPRNAMGKPLRLALAANYRES